MGYEFDKHTTSVADYELWALAHREKEPSKTSRFVTLSAGFHVIALVLVGMMATPLVDELKTETVTIEIEDVNPIPKFSSKGMDVPATQGSAAPVVAEKISAEDIVVPTAPVAALPVKELPAKALPEKVAAKPAAAPARSTVAAKTNFKAVPATIDDIEAPELDNGDYAKTPVASADLSDDLNKDFSKVDETHAEELENEKRAMDNMAEALTTEQDENLNNLAQDNEAEQERLNQAQEDLRQKNAAAVASALASEKAAAQEAAARENASRLAAQREAASRQAKADKAGQGVGNNGNPNQSGTALAGSPSGVRSLDQLRQMPGNPRPQYDREERRRGDQGEIAFVAYVSKEGYVTQFRLMKSTGFRSLDAKTLAALKKWRFYPGQEGWVELPFRWDLKGGVQEDGGMLRRAVSSR